MVDFAKQFPKQFLNAGVAEQNMTGIAAGLAMAGKIVFTYSIANFPTLRCIEQIRNDVCYHNANVVVVAVGGGYSYGALGMTHHATEDMAILRMLPQMTVLAPGDPIEAAAATRAVAAGIGPAIFAWDATRNRSSIGTRSTGRSAEPSRCGKATDVTLIVTGAMLPSVVEAAELLAATASQRRFSACTPSSRWTSRP